MTSLLAAFGLGVFSSIEILIRSIKDVINSLEERRIKSMLNVLRKDEERLSKCIDDIEDFHRYMFALPKKTDTENVYSLKENINISEHSATPEYKISPEYEPMPVVYNPEYAPELDAFFPECEPMYPANGQECEPIPPANGQEFEPMLPANGQECEPMPTANGQECEPMPLANGPECEPMSSVNDPDYLVAEEDSSMNEQYSAPEIIIWRFPGSSVIISENSGDEPKYSQNELDFSEDAESSSMHQSSMNEQHSSHERMILKIPKSKLNMHSSKKESDDEFESSFIKDEPDVIEQQMATSIILSQLADYEKEITKLVMQLIDDFSNFREDLQKNETIISQFGKYFPGNSNVKANRKMKSLSEQVSCMDETVSKIYAKYSEILENLGKKFL